MVNLCIEPAVMDMRNVVLRIYFSCSEACYVAFLKFFYKYEYEYGINSVTSLQLPATLMTIWWRWSVSLRRSLSLLWSQIVDLIKGQWNDKPMLSKGTLNLWTFLLEREPSLWSLHTEWLPHSFGVQCSTYYYPIGHLNMTQLITGYVMVIYTDFYRIYRKLINIKPLNPKLK